MHRASPCHFDRREKSSSRAADRRFLPAVEIPRSDWPIPARGECPHPTPALPRRRGREPKARRLLLPPPPPAGEGWGGGPGSRRPTPTRPHPPAPAPPPPTPPPLPPLAAGPPRPRPPWRAGLGA